MDRRWLPIALALGGLAAAVVAALGPATEIRTTYSWPPAALPDVGPTRAWYTPLLVARHRPEAISARLPCMPGAPLAGAERPTTVLATARSPGSAGGLAIVQEGSQLVVRVGEEALDRVPLVAGDRSCRYQLRMRAGHWSLDGGRSSSEGTVETMPVVTGLFSGLDLRREERPSIEILTSVHRTETIALQKVAWVLAALAIAGALLIVAVGVPSRRTSVTRLATRPHPADAVVAVALLAWWVLSPSFVDDGWVATRQEMFGRAGGFTNYFDTLGANLPNGYWLEWVQHWLTVSTGSLLVLRVPALLALAATWLLARWIVRRLPNGESAAVPWALAAAFLVSAFAWGMTLRPEPFTALLTIAVLACAFRFRERASSASLVGMAVFVPLAVTGHHAGVVALAPVLAVSPEILRWARQRRLEAGAILVSAVAFVVVLLFVGSDLEHRRADAETFRTLTSTTTTWRDEVLRYLRLSEFPNATPVRRASVALIGLAVFAYLVRRRRATTPLLDLPATSLGVACLLLVATPSKWAWHFGALIGVAAVAVAAETSRLLEDASRERGWHSRPFFVLGAACLVGAWLWSPRTPWSRLDLRSLDWTLGIERSLPFWTGAFVLPGVVLAVVGAAELARRGRARLREVPWRVAAYAAPVLAVPALVFTVGVLVADGVQTSSWTLARQNFDALRGDVGCGVADDVLVADETSLRPLPGAWLLKGVPVAFPTSPPGPEGIPSFTLGRRVGAMATPWFQLPADQRLGLFVAGSPGPGATLELEWGRRQQGRVQRLGTAQVPVSEPSSSELAVPSWGFLAASELPAEPAADFVRVRLGGDPGFRISVDVANPVTYANQRLSRRLAEASPVLVLPDFVTFVPCARQPPLEGGVVSVPRLILTPFEGTSWLASWETSPFEGLLDIYPPERVSVADSPDRPAELAVLEVDARIPGAETAPPRSTTTRS